MGPAGKGNGEERRPDCARHPLMLGAGAIGFGFKNPAPSLILGAAYIALPPLSCCATIWSMMLWAVSCPREAK